MAVSDDSERWIWQADACRCDRCGEPVSCCNCAVMFDRLRGDPVPMQLMGGVVMVKASRLAEMCLLGRGRHLLPTDRCEGSPSRAQHLTNVLRPGYNPPTPESRAKAERAYAIMKRMGPRPSRWARVRLGGLE